jgi:hypothetical protein
VPTIFENLFICQRCNEYGEKIDKQFREIPQEKGSKETNVWIVLLKDLGDYALYLNKTNNCFAGFEVHKIRIMKPKECDIKRKDGSVYHMSVPERRVIAGSEEFGMHAWHYPNIEMVYEKYPQFKKYSEEIEIMLDNASNIVKERFPHNDVDKTPLAHSKSSDLSRKSASIAIIGYVMSGLLSSYVS